MISSVTAAAAFAVSAAGEGSSFMDLEGPSSTFFDYEDYLDPREENEDINNLKPKSDQDHKPPEPVHRGKKFFEKLAEVAENLGSNSDNITSFVDQASMDHAARLIDSFIAQTNIVMRDVSLRIELPLCLPGVHRASGLSLHIGKIAFSNQSSASGEISGSHSSNSFTQNFDPCHSSETPGTQSSNFDPSDGTNSSKNNTLRGFWSWIWGSQQEKNTAKSSQRAGSQPTSSECILLRHNESDTDFFKYSFKIRFLTCGPPISSRSFFIYN
ncbi:unnamed protein product [Protopolystoma xenopodis]|uniref:Uncharacterized protein n=1 Tax=Protopolystoma xenopodis TaxID=117903 RepID=A0A3S5A170_9PLAT|nr:unnamed protein product [Protopolystoma xenopodis]